MALPGQPAAELTGDAEHPGDADLYDAGARPYDPGLGAFTQLDTVSGNAQNPLSLNRYLYAWANPMTMIDPTGHYPWGGSDCGPDNELCGGMGDPTCPPDCRPTDGGTGSTGDTTNSGDTPHNNDSGGTEYPPSGYGGAGAAPTVYRPIEIQVVAVEASFQRRGRRRSGPRPRHPSAPGASTFTPSCSRSVSPSLAALPSRSKSAILSVAIGSPLLTSVATPTS